MNARLLVFSALGFLLFAASSAAQQSAVVEVASGQGVEVVVTPNSPLKKISFALLSPNNKPLSLSISASAPQKATLTVASGAFPRNVTLHEALSSARALTPIELGSMGDSKRKASLVFGASSSNSGWKSEGELVCNGRLESKFVTYYTNLFQMVYQRSPNGIGELCDYLFNDEWKNTSGGIPSSGSPTVQLSDLGAFGILFKDMCSSNLTYLVVADLDLSSIPQELVAAGYTIKFSLSLEQYSGPDNMKLKRLGEGRFPEPLGITESMGSSTVSPELHVMATWRGGRMVRSQVFPVRKSLGYRGMYLVVTTPRRALRGGKVSWYATNYQQAYGACLKNAVPSNQFYNGYPKNA